MEVKEQSQSPSCHPLEYVVNYKRRLSGDIVTWGNRMRVLFVTQQIDYEPQGIMHLSSALKAAGHQVALAVAAHEDPVAVTREFRPGIVGYSVITGSQRYYLQLNRRLKQEVDVFSAFGGPHPTFFPEMIEEEGVDGICIGEGEKAIVDLADALEDGG